MRCYWLVCVCRHLKKLIVKWTGRLIRKSGSLLFLAIPLCYRTWPFNISSKPCLFISLLSSSAGSGLTQLLLVFVWMCRDITKTFPNFVFYTIVTDNPSSWWSWGMWIWIFLFGASWFFFFSWQKEMVQYCMLNTCFLLNFHSNSNCIWKLAFSDFILKQCANWQTFGTTIK